MELLKTFVYTRKKGNDIQKFIIREKDYGEVIVYDVFSGDTYLFTISQEGAVLFTNKVGEKLLYPDKGDLDKISEFIMHQQVRNMK